MSITLEEARTLEAFAKSKSLAETAARLRKVSSAVVYTLENIELKTGLQLFDRSGYRTTLNNNGEKLLGSCQKLFEAENEVRDLCQELCTGWESDVTIVFEGIYPLERLLDSLKQLSHEQVPTRFHLRAKFLGEVESAFISQKADFMISVLPPQGVQLESIKLPEIRAYLVAHRNHPLIQSKKKNSPAQLEQYPLLTVKGSDPRLNTSTAFLETSSSIELNDFHTKKQALISGLGFGWLPLYLIEREIKRGILKKIRWEKSSEHVFSPRLYFRRKRQHGRAVQKLIQELTENT